MVDEACQQEDEKEAERGHLEEHGHHEVASRDLEP